MKKLQLVDSIESFKVNVNYLNENLEAYAEVAQPGRVAAWYATRDAMNPTHWLFGPSKFIGYQGIRAEAYGSGQYALNGGETELHLQNSGWFEAVDRDHPLYEESRAIREFCVGARHATARRLQD